ncbi:MAG: vitamin B12 dependent-methionine synthase activation domain-containing protein [Eubacteriales bacterium]|jgi:hypothetical protein
MINYNKREMLRYLGYRGKSEPDAEMSAMIDRCDQNLQKVVTPKSCGEYFDLSVTGDAVEFAGLTIVSHSLARNLTGCTRIYLFAATLGVGPDRLIARAQVTKMSEALIYQAASAAMIEAVCNELNERIDREAQKENLYTRPRFSPGYGDCPIEFQKNFTEILQTPKRIGLTLTDSMMMMPSKSVTAVIGITSVPGKHHPGGCAACEVRNCEFRDAD